ncbi:hypothetical protein [Micrococcus sp. KRD096]|uniref:hypothetical protein n=1 Tax=Micrococcus sp. KRD096 TaxID=2729721 RepID=UPI0019D2D6AF|nr:hypothetical protein [Micrococcus sp. KRD096]
MDHDDDRPRYEFDDDAKRLASIVRKKHGPNGACRPKRRADGEGTVFPAERKRKNGSVAVYYRAARTVELGDRRKKSTAQARTECEAIQKRDHKILIARVEYGFESLDKIPVDPRIARFTVGNCLIDWLDERKREDLAPNATHIYDAGIRNYLLPDFGDRPVRTLTYAELEKFFHIELPTKGLGGDSTRQVFICLKSALDNYQRDGIDLGHPMVGIKPPPKKKKTKEDTKKIRQASKFLGKYLIPATTAADQEARWFLGMLGMRQGEVLGMTDSSLKKGRPGKGGSSSTS